MSKIVVKEFNVDDFCKDELGIKEPFFYYDDIKYRVDFRATYNKNLNNDGTPFVVGYEVDRNTQYLYVKTFLVLHWSID